MKKVFITIGAILFFFIALWQINFDYTDSLANQQRQYIIRFDVANGNIYLPINKKARQNYKRAKIFKRDIIPFKKVSRLDVIKNYHLPKTPFTLYNHFYRFKIVNQYMAA